MECDPPTGEEGGAKQRRSAQKLIERSQNWIQHDLNCVWCVFVLIGWLYLFSSCKITFLRYYYQLTTGCGQTCGNPHCASNSTPVAPNEAAAKALHLFKVFFQIFSLLENKCIQFTLILPDSCPTVPEAGGGGYGGGRRGDASVVNNHAYKRWLRWPQLSQLQSPLRLHPFAPAQDLKVIFVLEFD